MLLRGQAQLELTSLSGITFNADEAVMVVPLAPHLRALMVGFGLPDSMQQLPLFRAVGVR
jgi:hypothetical protein